jgi:hypothetical protein
MRTLVPIIKDYKHELVLPRPILNGFILGVSISYITAIVVLLCVDLDNPDLRPWVKRLCIGIRVIAVVKNC